MYNYTNRIHTVYYSKMVWTTPFMVQPRQTCSHFMHPCCNYYVNTVHSPIFTIVHTHLYSWLNWGRGERVKFLKFQNSTRGIEHGSLYFSPERAMVLSDAALKIVFAIKRVLPKAAHRSTLHSCVFEQLAVTGRRKHTLWHTGRLFVV